MSEILPRIRLDLDFSPSPSPDHPGLFIRDPYRYSDAMLVVPPLLAQCLHLFDGDHTHLDLRAELVRATGQFEVGAIAQNLIGTLSAAGFLADQAFSTLRETRCREFAEAAVREPVNAGSAYPSDPVELRETLSKYMTPDSRLEPAAADKVFAIAAPHVSPHGGWQSYRAAYSVLRPEHRDRTFVILATSHYGEPETFGLTRKTFRTPLGESPCDTGLVDRLEAAGGPAVSMEDYCHSFEHTIELQLIFLHHALGSGIRILPILCGSFAHSLFNGGAPEDHEGVRQFLDALSDLRAREGSRLFWILGVDMAHMGARYGDSIPAAPGQGIMKRVAERDHSRIERINASDAAGFWNLVRENHDDLKWCGSTPFYTFLKIAPGARGELLHYGQWDIDPQSAVTFAGMAFSNNS